MRNNILLLIALLLISLTGLKAGEFTGAGAIALLQHHQLNVRQIQAEGLKVGEVTGAGRRVFVDDVVQYVTNKNVVPSRRISHMRFKKRSAGKTVSELESIEFQGQRIKASDLKVIIYHR